MKRLHGTLNFFDKIEEVNVELKREREERDDQLGNKCIKSNGARFLCRKFEERRRLNFLRNVSNLINCKYDS